MYRKLLNDLNNTTSDILSSALISRDGLVFASSVKIRLDEEVIGAMSSAIHGLGSQVSSAFKRGALDQVMVKGEEGYVLITRAGTDSVLSVITNSRAQLGFIFMECHKASKAMAKYLM